MATIETSSDAGVQAVINYVRNPVGDGAAPLTFVTEHEDQSTMITLPGMPVWISDMREQETSLEREGFALVGHVSAASDLHQIEEDPAVDQFYINEMTEFLKDLTGASVVIMQGGGKKRYGPSATDKLSGLKNALPALYPHGDTTDRSARELADRILEHVPGLELSDMRRWAHINMWRPITPPPHDYPLAVCDARTLSDKHREPVVAHTETRTTETFAFETTGYLHDARHRWCYFSNMTPEEVLVFITYNSDPNLPHQVAHSAFLDPTCPAGTPARGSVEMRALALFT